MRGFTVAATSLSIAATVIGAGLVTEADGGRTYDALAHAGGRMLVVLTPFAALVVASLAAYWLLPMRESMFVIIVGLGPFTLMRPLVVAAASAAAVWGQDQPLVWLGTLLTAGGVLVVEPSPPLVRRTLLIRPYDRPSEDSAVVQSVMMAFWASARVTVPLQTAVFSLFSTESLSDEVRPELSAE